MVASEVDVLDDVLHIRIVVADPGQDLERLVEKRRPGVAQAFAALVGARQALARRGHDHPVDGMGGHQGVHVCIGHQAQVLRQACVVHDAVVVFGYIARYGVDFDIERVRHMVVVFDGFV